MTKFMKGDWVRYTGDSQTDLFGWVGEIKGVKVECSTLTGLPIYHIRWLGKDQTYPYGIREENLTLVSTGGERIEWEI